MDRIRALPSSDQILWELSPNCHRLQSCSLHRCDGFLVLVKALQMNLPEATLATLPLKPTGQFIVIGDQCSTLPVRDGLRKALRTSREDFRRKLLEIKNLERLAP